MIRNTRAEGASGPAWFKSSYSDSSNSNECLEVAIAPGVVRVRDSKNADGPQLGVAREAWAGFVAYAAGG
ncbi:DUF397 domain-containing protein [Streptomyces sp. Edi4]|uniref:DUF397 domain-containing protein n=1 Tax=Streptomyces sp. Edi4 TaxID=3162527 RepID=UPI0033059618